MKYARLLGALVAFVSLQSSPAAAASSWHWSFDTPEINLATSYLASITVTNDAGSDVDIEVEGISVQSFGDWGLLYEGNFKGVITPLILSGHDVLAPGDSVSGPGIQFYMNPWDLPTPGVRYDILPSLFVMVGNGCTAVSFDPAHCTVESATAAHPFTVTYAPVPEPSTGVQVLLGTLLVGLMLRRAPR